MSLADDAKILLIPSGYKTATPYGTLYSVFPTDGEQDFQIDIATTASRVNPGGLIETMSADTPRVDHFGDGCPSLLLEGNRTNLQVYSEDFNNSAWTKSNSTIDSNSIIAPTGEMTADKVIANTATGNHYVQDIASGLSTSSKATLSVFIKKDEVTQIELLAAQSSSPYTNWCRLRFDLNTLTTFQAAIGDYKYEDFGNGWLRLSITGTPTSSSAIIRFTLYKNNTSNWTGNNVDGFYLFGAQLEQGIGATSYIKTTTASVTRNFDNLECTTSYTLGTDATFYFDFEAYSYDSSFKQAFMIRNGAFTQYIDLISYVDSNIYYMRMRASANGGTQNYLIAFGERDIEFFQRNKVALRLYGNNYEIYVNGSQMKTGTSSAGNFDVVDGISIVNDFGASNTRPACKLYDFRVYDKTMTQSDLETLTTL